MELNKELIELLLSTPSVSGYELDVQRKLINYMKDIDDQVFKQENMNVIHVLNPNAQFKMLFLTHIDEVGLAVRKINNDGTVSVLACGGARAYMYAGQHVSIIHKGNKVPAVIGYLPNMDKGISERDLIVDLGYRTKEETEQVVEIGDQIVCEKYINYLNGQKLAGRALDDKIAVYIVAEVMKRVKGKTNLGIYFDATVGEETTSRGAKTSFLDVKPSIAITLDVCYANDNGYVNSKGCAVSLGGGPVLTKGSIMNQVLHEKMISTAKSLNMKYQLTVDPERTWTDGDHTYMNVPTYLISIPLRYMHSSVEVCDLEDIQNIIDLLTEFILKYDENSSLNPFDVL